MMTDRQLGCRERPTGTTEYLLSYGQPRVSPDVGVVMYEARRLRAERDDGDGAAVEWARDVVPYEFGLTYAGRQYLAAPMVLRRGGLVIWESSPGMALRAAV
jgi:hypothetical protein